MNRQKTACLLLVAFITLLLVGCGVITPFNIRHGETNLNFQQIAQIKPGKTTGQEIKDIFGEPNYNLNPPNWTYGRLSAWLGQSYYDKLQLHLDNKNVVQSYVYSQARYSSFPLIAASVGVKVNKDRLRDIEILDTSSAQALRVLGPPALYSVESDRIDIVYAQVSRFLFFTCCTAISAEFDKDERLTRLAYVDVPLAFMAIPFLPASETVGWKFNFGKFISCLDSGLDGKSFIAQMGKPQMIVRKKSSERYMYGEFSMKSYMRGYVEYRQRAAIIVLSKEKGNKISSILFVNTADRRQVVSILGFVSASDLLNSWSDLHARISQPVSPPHKLRPASSDTSEKTSKTSMESSDSRTKGNNGIEQKNLTQPHPMRSNREYILRSLSERKWAAREKVLREKIKNGEYNRKGIWKILGEPNRIDIRKDVETWFYARQVGEKNIFFTVDFSLNGKAVKFQVKNESDFQYPDIVMIVAQNFSF